MIFLATLVFAFVLASIISPLKIETEYSKIITAKDGTILHAFLTSDEKWRLKTELDEISPEMQRAIVHKEDRYFKYHIGINPIAVSRALFRNITTGRRTSGASTITMQVARMLNRKPRTYGNKLREMFRAVQLELSYSKKEILQLYLNLVPYGGNIEGVKSASVFYLNKSPDQLSIAELTALSIIPNRPTSLVPGKTNGKIRAARDIWLNVFLRDAVFSEEKIVDALDEDFIAYRRKRPELAHHYSYRLMEQYPNKNTIATNIDLDKQTKTEEILQAHIGRLYGNRIRNASAIVINNKTAAVEVYVGSANFYNTEDGGQVDGVRAIRSPGSTLKPLIYAMGFERGIICPKSRINDVPINFAGYSPVNFDQTYKGMVSVEEALALSLNVPAVEILNRLKTEDLITLMEQSGFDQVRKDRDKLGLSVALGGCGVRLEELAGMYSAFSREGQFRSLVHLQDETSDSITLVSPAAAFMTSNILSKVQRPDLPSTFAMDAGLPKIAWKTGTSYGRRDAWSVGYNGQYTVAVWVGNFSGEGVPELQGSTTAAPLLFEIFNNIDRKMNARWFVAPVDVDERWVCSETGQIPDHFCEDRIMDFYIPGKTITKLCEHERQFFVAKDTSVSYCRACKPDAEVIQVAYPNLDPAVLTFYEEEFIHYDKVPEHNRECTRVYGDTGPEITSLKDGLEYLIDKADNPHLALAANARNDVENISWFINDRFLATIAAGEQLFFEPNTPTVKISCTDDKGRNRDIKIKVQIY